MYGNKNQYTCIADWLLEEPENQNECIVLSFFPREKGLLLGLFSASSFFSPYLHDAGQGENRDGRYFQEHFSNSYKTNKS